MKFGVFMFPTDYSMAVVDLAREVEQRGFESIWVPEHTHIPTSRRTPHPSGGDLPLEYSHALDPFVALAAAAAATTRLRLGTGVCLVVEHDPIVLAKEVATLDYISGGRCLFGVGGGWNREEMQNHGTNPSQRFKVLRERMLAMKRIWTSEEAEFHGQFVDFDPIWQWPKPVQKPHPPILVGGNGPGTLKRVIEYGDEWMPIVGRGPSIDERFAELQRLAAEAGRQPVPVSVFGAPRDQKAIESYQKLGVARCIFWLRPGGTDETLPVLDECAEVAASFD
ncbi:MAG TPA: LLM class F420-dependent oxidoreductase [Chloroflexota bacterium]|nr:LLM class F420-dependent oxidoreductase [Chloroflexota bacterium]